MFRISRRLDYGLHLMVELGSSKNNQPKSTASLAEKLEMPLPFLHQIAHSLMQSGLIKATPGPRGGLRLNRSANDISILQIVEALEGPIDLNPVGESGAESACHPNCPSQGLWSELQQKILLYLGAIYLDTLIQQREKMEVFSMAFNSSSSGRSAN